MATFTVTNTDDGGAGSLRAAILAANTTANITDPDRIEFGIPGAGPHTIQPRSLLPPIDDPVVVDGYSQPGSLGNTNGIGFGTNAVLQIELDGSMVPDTGDHNGIVITGHGQQSTISGLAIGNFLGSAIRIDASNGNLISGNFLGTDAAGTVAAPNGFAGIQITDGSQNEVGGQNLGDRNVISGNNGPGLLIEAFGNGPQNVIQGNLIGVASDGFSPLGNNGDGVLLNNVIGTMIGGVALPESGNVIAHNNGNGVSILGDGAVSHSILGNSIFTNQQLPIDLNGDGPTANDGDDADLGPNSFQNFPVLDSVISGATTTTISGSLTSVPDTNYRIEFFLSGSVNSAGQSQAEQFLGATFVTIPNGQTTVNFANFTIPVAVPRGHFISATATSANGDTSELSAAATQLSNHDPVVGDDTFSTDEDTLLSADVLSSVLLNDTDVDGDILSVADADTVSQRGAAVSVQPDGSFTYDPSRVALLQTIAEGDTLADSFIYSVGDANTGTATGTVNIAVLGVNDVPTAADVASFAFEDGPSVTLAFRGDDVDTDDDSTSLTYTITSPPGEGTVSNNDDGTFSFDPGSSFQDLAIGQSRTVTFTYDAEDSHDAISNTGMIAITVVGVNDVPTFTLAIGPTVLEDAGATMIGGFASAIDPGNGDAGQTLTFDTMVASITGGLTFTTAPAIDATSGDLTLETSADANGSATVAVQLNDDGSTGGPIVLTIPAGGGNDIVDGETFSISETASGVTTIFEFDSDRDFTTGNQPIDFASDSIVSDLVDSFIIAANAAGLGFLPVDLGGGHVLASASSDNTTVAIINSPNLAQTSGPNGQSASAPQTFIINIAPVNDAPINTVPGAQTVAEETTTAINGISISDLDAGVNDLTTRLQVTNGVLDVALSGSATISAGTDGTSDVTIQGGLVDINATLTSLTYTGNTDVVGADSLVITTDDAGNTGAVARQDIDNIAIDITPVNDDPTNVGSLPTDIAVTEDLLSNVDLSAINLSDVDAADGSLILTLTTSDGGNLSSSAGGGVAVSGSGTGMLTLTSTLDRLNTFLNSASNIQYLHATEHLNGDVSDTIQVDVADNGSTGFGGGGTIDLGSVNVNITPVNDAPILNDGVSPMLAPLRIDVPDDAGLSVSSLVNDSGDLIMDVDDAAFEGIAVVATSGSGDWEFSVDEGATFSSFGNVSVNAALLLQSTSLIRYQPSAGVVAGSPDMPSMTFRGWDLTSNDPDTTQNGGATAFSNTTRMVATRVALTLGELRPNADDDTKSDLVISDGVAGGKSDRLQLSLDASGTELVITDNSYLIGDFTDAPATANSLQIPISRISSGVIEIDLGDGDNTLDIDFNNAPAQGINLSLVINGGSSEDRLTFVNSNALGSGSISMNDQIEEIFVLGPITTNDAPVTLSALRSVELNAAITTNGSVGNGQVQIASGHDILGLNCAAIDAGDASVTLVGTTGIADVGIRTSGTASLTSLSGGISACNGVTSVQANSLTLNVATSVGGALLTNGELSIVAPMQVDINELRGAVGGLGIFLVNPRALIVDDALATGTSPAGQKVISIVPNPPIAPLPEGESSPWQNQRNAFDVNDDSFVSPLDALATINFLNGATTIGSGEASVNAPVMFYLDVNGDRLVSPIDALQIINHLTARDRFFAEGESELASSNESDPTDFPSSIYLRPRHRNELTLAPSTTASQTQRSSANTLTSNYRVAFTNRALAQATHEDQVSHLDRFATTDLESALDELSYDIADHWRESFRD